jgi:peptidoglycan/LPS O-acetylase OafA/YrhL
MRWFIGTLGYPFGMGRFGESIWGYTTIGLVSVALISLAATKSMLDPCLNLGSLQYIGRVSYGFYVFHLPVVKLVLNLLDRVNPPGPAHGLVAKLSVLGLNTIAFLLCFGITLTLAHLSYKWWETRFLRLKKKVT